MTLKSSNSDSPEDNTEVDFEFPQANIIAVRAIASVLETTLGPLSHDKLVVEKTERGAEMPSNPAADEFVVTNDGATILTQLPIKHPLAPILQRMIGPEYQGETDVEGKEISDGVTTRAVLARTLLNKAESLLEQGLHPQMILRGYGRAREIAHQQLLIDRILLEDIADERAVRIATARTAMTGNDIAGLADTWSELAVDAVELVGMPDEVSFVVRQTNEGMISDSRLVRGAVLDRSERADQEMPRQIKDAAVLVLNGHDRGGLQERESSEEITASLSSSKDTAKFETSRYDRKRRIVSGFVDAGVDVVVTRLGIDQDYQRLLTDNGILGIRGITRLDLQQIARATGATHVMDPTDATSASLGYAGRVKEQVIEPYEGRRKRRRMIVFDGCSNPQSVAVMLRGVFTPLATQATTQIRKAALAAALASGANGQLAGITPGGGASHIRIANAVRQAARENGSRMQLAMEAFADAAEALVGTLARNAGLDPLTTVANIRVAHEDGLDTAGVILPEREVGDCLDARILDPVALTDDAYLYATAISNIVLRIDDTIDTTSSNETMG